MTTQATTVASKSSNQTLLDELYSLINNDLDKANKLILSRVNDEIPLITDIVNHIISSGGKRIRPALTLICSKLCGYEGDTHIPLSAAVEFIHTATLLHDDVVDESKLRRGIATSNEIFGNKASVLVGDFLFSQAFQLMVESGSLKVLKILSDASAIISKGEVMQLMTEGEPQTSISDYLEVVKAKTAILFASACELGAVVSQEEDKEITLRNFGMNIGIAFQLVDDALDYIANEKTLGKTIGDDFREGKITLPVILAYEAANDDEKQFWIRTLTDLKQNNGDLEKAVSLIKKHDTIGKTIEMAQSYCKKSKEELVKFPESSERNALFNLVDFCIDRAY
ncbi:MAG: polyprenyl synthetase family protein [Rickettsiales bacterium]